GVMPDARVALCAERGVDLIVGALGIMKAGGAYVPLDPSYPEERLSYMMQDCQARIVVAERAALGQLPAAAATTVFFDEGGGEPDSAPEVDVGPRNLAYVIYTSGSTGRPKGAMVEHRGLINTAIAQIEAFRIDERSRVLQFASPSFDASASEIF